MKTVTHETIWETILAKMRSLLSEKGMTQIKLARMLGVDRATISRWLKGERKASKSNPEIIFGYMHALGMNTDSFFGKEEDENFIEIPWVDATASMGTGSLLDSKHHDFDLAFRADWIARQGNYKNMVVINASGGSMEPTIPDGAVVLVDETPSKLNDLVNGKIYFVRLEGELFLKRLKVIKGKTVSLISDADGSEMSIGDAEDFAILARALWYGKDL